MKTQILPPAGGRPSGRAPGGHASGSEGRFLGKSNLHQTLTLFPHPDRSGALTVEHVSIFNNERGLPPNFWDSRRRGGRSWGKDVSEVGQVSTQLGAQMSSRAGAGGDSRGLGQCAGLTMETAGYPLG